MDVNITSNSRTSALFVTRAISVPIIVRKGILTSTMRIGRSRIGGLRKDRLSVCASFLLHRTAHKIATNKFMDITMGKVESGFDKPKIGNIVFKNKPINIRRKILKPTETRMTLYPPRLLNLRVLSNKNPGTNVIKRKPSTCLATKILKNRANSVAT